MPNESEGGNPADDPENNPPLPNIVPQKQETPQNQNIATAKNDVAASETKRELHWLEKLNFGGQFCLVIVGIIAASIYGCQLGVMKSQLSQMEGSSKQTDAMLCLYREQLEELERQSISLSRFASASVDQARAATHSQEPRFVLHYDAPAINDSIAVTGFHVANNGPSDARKVNLTLMSILLKADEPDPPFVYHKGVSTFIAPIWAAGQTTETTHPDRIENIAIEESDLKSVNNPSAAIEDFTRGKRDIMTYGKLTFWDGFGGFHSQTFCSTQTKNMKRGRHKKCAEYNSESYGYASDRADKAVAQKIANASDIPPPKPCPQIGDSKAK
jgi:hypothetical protein